MPPEEFDDLAAAARERGFLVVSASPLTRSSYHAQADFRRLQAARIDAESTQSRDIRDEIAAKHKAGLQRPSLDSNSSQFDQ
jgi:hypothetical protein